MSLQWLSVAAFLYTEIGLGLLLCLGFISNARLVILSVCDGNTALLRIIAEISRNKWKDQTRREFNFLFQNVKDLASLLDSISSLRETI